MINAMFEELKTIAGWNDSDCRGVTITGRDPALPTRFLVGENAAGVHAKSHGGKPEWLKAD